MSDTLDLFIYLLLVYRMWTDVNRCKQKITKSFVEKCEMISP